MFVYKPTWGSLEGGGSGRRDYGKRALSVLKLYGMFVYKPTWGGLGGARLTTWRSTRPPFTWEEAFRTLDLRGGKHPHVNAIPHVNANRLKPHVNSNFPFTWGKLYLRGSARTSTWGNVGREFSHVNENHCLRGGDCAVGPGFSEC